jgi:hypothetical protein
VRGSSTPTVAAIRRPTARLGPGALIIHGFNKLRIELGRDGFLAEIWKSIRQRYLSIGTR